MSNAEICFVGIDSLVPNIIKGLKFIDSTTTNIIFVNSTQLEYFDFWEIKELNHNISIQGIIPFRKDESTTGKTAISIYPDIADKFQFDYSKFEIKIPSFLNALGFQKNKIPVVYSDSFRLFSKLLEGQKKNFFMEGLEKADVDLHETRLKHYNHFDDRFSKYLWNYSYEKERIFCWAFSFFLIFFLIHMMLLKFLCSEVYSLENIAQRLHEYTSDNHLIFTKGWRRFTLSFFYTATIFWGLKLDIDKFKFKNTFGTIYILICYIVGLVSTFFVGSYIYLKLTS
jgi:hypothetical protein